MTLLHLVLSVSLNLSCNVFLLTYKDFAVILFLYGVQWISFMVQIFQFSKKYIKAQLSALELRATTGSRGSHRSRVLPPTRQIHISSTISSPISSYLHNSYNPISSDLPPTYPRSSSSRSHFRDHERTRDHSRDHSRHHSRDHSRRNFSINPSPLSYSFISSSDHYSCNSDD